MKTFHIFGMDLPLLADLPNEFKLVLHPNGPAIATSDCIASLDHAHKGLPETVRNQAIENFIAYAMPRLRFSLEPKRFEHQRPDFLEPILVFGVLEGEDRPAWHEAFCSSNKQVLSVRKHEDYDRQRTIEATVWARMPAAPASAKASPPTASSPTSTTQHRSAAAIPVGPIATAEPRPLPCP